MIVWDIFTVQEYTILPESRAEARQRILDEEQRFSEMSSVALQFEALPDAYLRGYQRLRDILGCSFTSSDIPEAEREVYDTIIVGFSRIYNAALPNQIGLPLGIGAHVDHVLAREAGLSWWQGLPVKDRPTLFLYEELPYALHPPWVERALDTLASAGWRLVEHLIPVDGWIERKRELVGQYQSQIGPREIERLIEHASILGQGGQYERIWCVTGQRI